MSVNSINVYTYPPTPGKLQRRYGNTQGKVIKRGAKVLDRVAM